MYAFSKIEQDIKNGKIIATCKQDGHEIDPDQVKIVAVKSDYLEMLEDSFLCNLSPVQPDLFSSERGLENPDE